jgi:hypothetical protein
VIEPFYPSKCGFEECDIYNKIISTFKLIEIKSSRDQDLICEYKKGKYEFRVYDSEGRITGLVQGRLKQEIPRSIYKDGDVFIQFPEDYYEYEIYCIKDGNYKFEKSSLQEGEVITFKVINIPIFSGITHRYKINWKTLAQGKNGVNLFIDNNGDGVFEKNNCY